MLHPSALQNTDRVPASCMALTFLITWYLRLVLLKDAENITGFFICSCFIMSWDTLGVAVAVSAMMGTLGNRCRKTCKRLHAPASEGHSAASEWAAVRKTQACIKRLWLGGLYLVPAFRCHVAVDECFVELKRTYSLAGSHVPTACTTQSQCIRFNTEVPQKGGAGAQMPAHNVQCTPTT